MFHVSLRRMYILLLLDEVFYKCQLGPVDWWCCLVQHYPGRFSACWICQLSGVVVLKSLTTRGDSSISLSLYHSLLHTFWSDTVRHIHIRGTTSSRTLPLPLLQYLFFSHDCSFPESFVFEVNTNSLQHAVECNL